MRQEKPGSDKSKTNYSLSLAGGHSWNLMATEEAMALVERIASAMQLDNSSADDAPRLIITGNGRYEKSRGVPFSRLDRNMKADLPRSGWRGRNYGTFRFWFHAEREDVVYQTFRDVKNYRELDRVLLYLFPVYRKVFRSGGITVHGALVEWDGGGVIMAGRSQAGKSTCCRRLPPPWRVLGDEEAIVVRDDHGSYLAHPFPTWSDYYERKMKKSWDVQRSVPLRAIFFLEQAALVEVAPMGRAMAAIQLCRLAVEKAMRCWSCADADDILDLRRRLFENACEMVKKIPVHTMRTTLTGRFWEVMEDVIVGREQRSSAGRLAEVRKTDRSAAGRMA